MLCAKVIPNAGYPQMVKILEAEGSLDSKH